MRSKETAAPPAFAGTGIPRLRPYQVEAARAILESVLSCRGLTFTVEIARQGGKNELSAQMELFLLGLNLLEGGNGVKCSPTFRPQTLNSMRRLKDRLRQAGLAGHYKREQGYALRLGRARILFFSASPESNVVGHTADWLLEVDEAQDVEREKYQKDFKPMGATTNVTTVLYGTAWDETTLLEEQKELNLELERHDGIRRHFEYDWEAVAAYNPAYRAYVEAERQRLGEDHPLFQTQYCLHPLGRGGRFLSAAQRAQLQGHHGRCERPLPGCLYVAGIDLAGESEEAEDALLRRLRPAKDSTVVTIAQLLPAPQAEDLSPPGPRLRIVQHYWWTGRKHPELYAQLVDLLRNVWRCRRVVVDATGVGEPVASFLAEALGKRVVRPFVFTAQSKSKLGFDLLAAINSGGLKMYTGDGSAEEREFWRECELARRSFRANQTMNFYVDPVEGHDDFLISAALVVQAAQGLVPRQARGRMEEP